MATVAPTASGKNNSSAAISKAMVVTATSVARSSRPGSRAIEVRKFTTERCEISTPLGRPVVPEVKMT